MALNSFSEVLQNAISLLVVWVVLYWIYRNMENNAVKQWIDDMFEKLKGGFKNG